MISNSMARLVKVGDTFEERWSLRPLGVDNYRFNRQLYPRGGYVEFGARLADWAGTTDSNKNALWTYAQEAAPVAELSQRGSRQQAVDFFVDHRCKATLRLAANVLVQQVDDSVGENGIDVSVDDRSADLPKV